MPLFSIEQTRLQPLTPVTFFEAHLSERHDLQRLLRDHIDVIATDCLVIAEEFSQWEDSQRRIDLLAVSRNADLVVIELKITEDGGHMELQAIRYAAMVSAMTFDQAVDAFAAYLRERGREGDARQLLLDHLGWDSPDDHRFGEEARIVLVSPDFSRELTSAVLWLRGRGVDIECVRFRPHRFEGALVADVQRIIPLPEAEDFQVRLRQKALQEQAGRARRTTVDEMLARIRQASSSDELAVVERLIAHGETLGFEWFANTASLGQSLRTDSGPAYVYTIRPEQELKIEIEFKWLMRREPFTSEGMREELRARLVAIPGVVIPAEKIAGAPKFAVRCLIGEGNRLAFEETMSWLSEKLVIGTAL